MFFGMNAEEHLEAKQQRQDSKNRSKKDAIITDILDALYSLDSRRIMPLFAIDPSGIGQIPKHNPEQLDAVALHERVRKLESDHHTRDVISELQSKRCDELENKITELSTSLLQHANSIKTLKPTYASISNSVNNKNRHIVKHSTDSTNDASTAEHVPTKRTANENVPATPSPSVQQEDNEGVFRIPREHARKQQRQDKRRKNTIYGTAKGGNIIGGLRGVKTRHLFIYGTRKEISTDAIKTLLIENDITVFNAAVVSNELATYKSFRVTIPADQMAAACLPAIWPEGIRVRDLIYPVKQTHTNNGD